MYIDKDNRKMYSIQDLSLEELHALRRAIGHANLPDRGTLLRLQHHLEGLPPETKE